MRVFIGFVAPSAVTGAICGVLNLDVYWALGCVLIAQYIALLIWREGRREDGQVIGTVIGLSTTIFIPVGFVCFLLGRAASG
jgi:hypothetical protein